VADGPSKKQAELEAARRALAKLASEKAANGGEGGA
jgi:hypothetical protein